MKELFVGEDSEERLCAILSTRMAALRHFDACGDCQITRFVLRQSRFQRVGRPLRNVKCENCGKRWRAFYERGSFKHKEFSFDFCSKECRKETVDFYENGGRGIFGYTTQAMKHRIATSGDPYKGCVSRAYSHATVTETPSTP